MPGRAHRTGSASMSMATYGVAGAWAKPNWTGCACSTLQARRSVTFSYRSGVPTYVIYPGGKDSNADVLPELLTKDIVSKAIDKDLLMGTARSSR